MADGYGRVTWADGNRRGLSDKDMHLLLSGSSLRLSRVCSPLLQ